MSHTEVVGQFFVNDELPIGARDGSNLTYQTQYRFQPGSLEVYLSGDKMNANQSDPERDLDVTTTGANAFKEFTFIIKPNVPEALCDPPCQGESLLVNYRRCATK